MTRLSRKARQSLASREFAFAEQRKEPLENANHVRNAVARFDQVTGVTDAERDAAWGRILAAAKTYGVTIDKASWRDYTHPAAAAEA
jgi:hypothetical protein